MRILILGATGFLGSRLYQLASEDKNVTVYGTSRFENEQSTILPVDVTNENSISRTFKKIDPEVVIWSLMNFQEEYQLIKQGLQNVLSKIDCKTKLVFMSSDSVFVDGRGDYTECDSIGSLPKHAPLSNYVNGKSAAENMILNSHSNHVILRTGPLYGDNKNHIEARTLQLIERAKENQPIQVWTNVYRTFVNVTDLSNAILELCENDYKGILHVGPLYKESYYTFFKKRFAQLGWNNSLLNPMEISKEAFPYLSLDTSLDTKKAQQILQTDFRRV